MLCGIATNYNNIRSSCVFSGRRVGVHFRWSSAFSCSITMYDVGRDSGSYYPFRRLPRAFFPRPSSFSLPLWAPVRDPSWVGIVVFRYPRRAGITISSKARWDFGPKEGEESKQGGDPTRNRAERDPIRIEIGAHAGWKLSFLLK